jgi:hypothetical protein
MSYVNYEDFEALHLSDPMATTRSMAAERKTRVTSVRPVSRRNPIGPLEYIVDIPENAGDNENTRGVDVAVAGLDVQRIDLTGIRESENGNYTLDFKQHITVSVNQRRQGATQRQSCDCGNWSRRLPHPCMVNTQTFHRSNFPDILHLAYVSCTG